MKDLSGTLDGEGQSEEVTVLGRAWQMEEMASAEKLSLVAKAQECWGTAGGGDLGGRQGPDWVDIRDSGFYFMGSHGGF